MVKGIRLVNQESWSRSHACFSSLPDGTLNRGPVIIFQDKSKGTYCGEAGYYALPNEFSPRDLVFIPDLSDIN